MSRGVAELRHRYRQGHECEGGEQPYGDMLAKLRSRLLEKKGSEETTVMAALGILLVLASGAGTGLWFICEERERAKLVLPLLFLGNLALAVGVVLVVKHPESLKATASGLIKIVGGLVNIALSLHTNSRT